MPLLLYSVGLVGRPWVGPLALVGGWPMIVGIDDYAQVANSEYGRNRRRMHIPKRLGYFGIAQWHGIEWLAKCKSAKAEAGCRRDRRGHRGG
jgi:hypothetical protein